MITITDIEGVLARALSFYPAKFARTIMREELAQMVEHWIVISRGQGFESLTILFYFFQVRRRCRKCPVKNLS